MYSLWKHDNNGTLVPDVEEIRLIYEFRHLWKVKMQGMKGDKSGNNKLYNTEWLRYIFFMDDFRSPYADLPEKQRHLKALKETEFHEMCIEEGIDPATFKGDELVTTARRRYRWLMDCAEVKILRGLKKGLYNGNLYIDFVNKKLTNLLDKGEDAELDLDQMQMALKAMDDIMTLSDKLPKAIDNINAYEKKVAAIYQEHRLAKGKIAIPSRADPTLKDIQLD